MLLWSELGRRIVFGSFMYYILTYIKKGTPRSIPPASLMNMINPINYGVLIVVHMEYKLQLYKVSSKSDEDYESFLNGPLFNG